MTNNEILEKLEAIRSATVIGAKDVLTMDECVLYTGYSKTELYSKTSKREIPHYKRGNFLYFVKSELNDWLTAHPIPTKSEIGKQADTYTAINN